MFKDSKEFAKWLESDDNFAIVRPVLDRYATKAISTHKAKNPATVPDVAKRIDAIEAAYQAKARELELNFHLRIRAAESGVDASLLAGIRFEDEQQIDERIEALSSYTETTRTDTRREMLSESHQPASGQEPGADEPSPFAGRRDQGALDQALRMFREQGL